MKDYNKIDKSVSAKDIELDYEVEEVIDPVEVVKNEYRK